jgi:hypothetical protein
MVAMVDKTMRLYCIGYDSSTPDGRHFLVRNGRGTSAKRGG